MSEKIIHPESHASHETTHSKEHHERLAKHHEAAVEKAKKEQSELNLAKLREQAKTHAEQAEHTKVELPHDKAPDAAYSDQKQLKAAAYAQTLGRIQHRLSKPDRALSKVVHNKTVETVSNVGAATVARPSGLLGGSICAFVGSVVLLYSAKHYGFRYNYLVFVMLFVAGFCIGSAIELLAWAAFGRKRQYQS